MIEFFKEKGYFIWETGPQSFLTKSKSCYLEPAETIWSNILIMQRVDLIWVMIFLVFLSGETLGGEAEAELALHALRVVSV
jgi:hypothetical protein